jgi:hypothetical protein
LASTLGRGIPADRLVIQDHAADELGCPRGREQQLAVGLPALGRGLDLERLEALAQRARCLVGRQDSLAVGDQ